MDDSPVEPQKQERPSQGGALIGIIIIIVLVALGGFYLVKKEINRTPATVQEQANS